MSWFHRLLETKASLEEADYKRAEKLLVTDAMCAMGMASLAGGPFLAAFALANGATNYEIGMLATIALMSQLMQLPGLFLANFLRKRRAITSLLSGVSRLLWIFIILSPVFFADHGITFILQWVLIASLVGAMVGPAWNSLLRDIVPRQSMGRLFARRLAVGTALSLAFTLAGGFFIDWWQLASPDTVLYAYSALFSVGVMLGVAGSVAVSMLPEPTMRTEHGTSVWKQLAAPVQSENFRRLLVFIGMWSFAINMAGPFFIVYMLQRIGIPFSMVTMLTVTSQVANLVFLKIWGKMADRFSSKSVFAVAGPMFFISVIAWSFTTMPERYFLTIPLLFMIHILSGASLAGVNVSSSSMALKLSDPEKTHAYMTVFALVAAACGACGPFVGGMLADFFATRELALSLSWTDPARELSVYAINFKALDFVFVAAFLAGLMAVHKLAFVKEDGEVPEDKVVADLVDQVVQPFKMVSSVDGLINRVSRPVSSVLKARARTRRRKPKTQASAEPGAGAG